MNKNVLKVTGVLIVTALIIGWMFFNSKPTAYDFNPSHDVRKRPAFQPPFPEGMSEEEKAKALALGKRPYKEERLLLIEKVENIEEKTPGLPSASITNTLFTKRLDCQDLDNLKKVSIRMEESDYAQLGGVKPGDRLAAFGLESSQKTFFRLEKYPAEADASGVKDWYQKLQ